MIRLVKKTKTTEYLDDNFIAEEEYKYEIYKHFNDGAIINYFGDRSFKKPELEEIYKALKNYFEDGRAKK